MKDNAIFHVTKVIHGKTRQPNPKGVIKEQYITLGFKNGTTKEQRLKLRTITFKAKDGNIYVLITNNFSLAASHVALIYKTDG